MMRGLFAVALMFAAGCGSSDHPPVYPVTGVVTYQGKPVAEASIALIPTGESQQQAPSATTDASGRFQLATVFSADVTAAGSPPGNYTVLITKVDGIFDPYAQGEASKPKHLLPLAYSRVGDSPLEVTVEPKKNHFTWELKD